MKIFHDLTDPHLIRLLKEGGIGIIPTDTLYGIVAVASNPVAVKRLYDIRHRDRNKACIILAASRQQIADTDAWQSVHWRMTKKYWPGPISMVLPTTSKTAAHLHHGDQSPPYRIPNYSPLRALLQQTGPVVAPSANPQGQPPASTIQEAIDYFGPAVDFYVDAGQLTSQPSTLTTFAGDKAVILRQGAGKIDPKDIK